MMINDRGSKKWTAIMLPEHVEMLKEVFAEDEYKEKPILDEQQIWENEAVLQSALDDGSVVEIKYFKDHDFHYIKGTVLFIDVFGGVLRLDDRAEVPLTDIMEVNIL